MEESVIVLLLLLLFGSCCAADSVVGGQCMPSKNNRKKAVELWCLESLSMCLLTKNDYHTIHGMVTDQSLATK